MKKKILLIEDGEKESQLSAEIYEHYFKLNNFEVKRTLKLELKEIKQEKPNFILLFFILHPPFLLKESKTIHAQRIKFLEELKKDSETKDIPVFVLGNYNDWEIKEMNLKLDKYLLITDYIPSQIIKMVKEFKTIQE